MTLFAPLTQRHCSGILATATTDAAKYNCAPASHEIRLWAEALEDLCRENKADLFAVAMQFPLAHPTVPTVIPSDRTEEQYAKSSVSLVAPIPTRFLAALRDSALVHDDAPEPGGSLTGTQKGVRS